MSYTDLGKATGLSTSAVHQRVRRLEERGVITGYAATVSPEALGLPLTALISVTPFDPSAPDDVPQRLATSREIEDCHSVAGVESYILKVRVATPGQPRGPARPHPLRRQRLDPHHRRPVDAVGGPQHRCGATAERTEPRAQIDSPRHATPAERQVRPIGGVGTSVARRAGRPGPARPRSRDDRRRRRRSRGRMPCRRPPCAAAASGRWGRCRPRRTRCSRGCRTGPPSHRLDPQRRRRRLEVQLASRPGRCATARPVARVDEQGLEDAVRG